MSTQQNKNVFWCRTKDKGMLPHLPDEVLSPKVLKSEFDILSYISSKHVFEHTEPKARWEEGFPLGNGRMGAMAYGAPDNFRFAIGANDIWNICEHEGSSYPKGTFSDLRQALENGDKQAFEHLKQSIVQRGDQATSSLKPGAVLSLELFPASLANKFSQCLNLGVAENTCSFNPAGANFCADSAKWINQLATLTSFVHAAHNVLALQANAGYERFHFLPPVKLSLWRNPDVLDVSISTGVQGNLATLSCAFPGGIAFTLAVSVVDAKVSIQNLKDRVFVDLTPTSRNFSVFVALITSEQAKNHRQAALKLARRAAKDGFDCLQKTHRQWWAEYWQRGYMTTPWQDLEKYWYYALYLQASMARPGCPPPGLQGPWVQENQPAWNGDYHANWNQQVLYWGQYAANRLENAEPLYRLYDGMLPLARQESQAYFQGKGTRLPIAGDSRGHELCRSLSFNSWPGSTGWIAQHYYWHYKYSADRTFLKEHAYPMLQEAGWLYEDVFYEEEDGTLSIWPSTHGEWGGSEFEGIGKNSTYDISLARSTFAMLAECARELGKQGEADHWQNILDRIAPMPTDDDGCWKELQDCMPLGVWAWHLTFPVFPMEIVSADTGKAEERHQALRTWQRVKDYNPDGFSYGSFTAVQVAAAAAMLADGQGALDVTNGYLKHVNAAGLIGGRDGSWLQVDGPPGFSVIANLMLLQSDGGIIRVFPALPDYDVDLLFHSLRAQGGFLVSAESRQDETRLHSSGKKELNQRTIYVIIKSLAGNDCTLKNPINVADGIRIREWQSRKVILETKSVMDPYITFPTQKGKIYVIDSPYHPYEDYSKNNGK